MKLFFEKYIPLLTSSLATLWIYLYKTKFSNFNQLFDQITTNSLSVSGALVGFFLTILTIIHTINTRRMKFVRDAGLLPRLLWYLNISIISHIIIISIGLFLPIIRQIIVFKGVAFEGKIFVIFLTFLTWIFSVRFTYYFITLLHDPKPKTSQDNFVPAD